MIVINGWLSESHSGGPEIAGKEGEKCLHVCKMKPNAGQAKQAQPGSDNTRECNESPRCSLH